MEISKELLSEVLKIEIISYQMKQKNIIGYEYNKVSKNEWSGKKFCNRSINIYELAFKCKEWAYSKCNEIISYTEGCEIFQTQMGEKTKDFYADTEIEAIFKACQWILDNK